MRDRSQEHTRPYGPSRRDFLERIGRGTVAGGVVASLLGKPAVAAAESGSPSEFPASRVRQRPLGNTGLSVSEIGFGGHSWSYEKIPDAGKLRRPTVDEAVDMIRAGLDMGVNFFDSCTPTQEHTTPGEAIKRLKKRDEIIVCARCCHKMNGIEADKNEVYKFVDERLPMWQTDRFDILILSNVKPDYWDMSYCIEALAKVKQQGKVRFTGFGCHFTPENFRDAIDKYGRSFDVCSLPYNIRHRAGDSIMPAAEKAGLGIISIKPFARGSLLKDRKLDGPDANIARDMVAFVLENPLIDSCLCGVHTLANVKENFSASWTKLSPAGRERLDKVSACAPVEPHSWLESGWRYA